MDVGFESDRTPPWNAPIPDEDSPESPMSPMSPTSSLDFSMLTLDSPKSIAIANNCELTSKEGHSMLLETLRKKMPLPLCETVYSYIKCRYSLKELEKQKWFHRGHALELMRSLVIKYDEQMHYYRNVVLKNDQLRYQPGSTLATKTTKRYEISEDFKTRDHPEEMSVCVKASKRASSVAKAPSLEHWMGECAQEEKSISDEEHEADKQVVLIRTYSLLFDLMTDSSVRIANAKTLEALGIVCLALSTSLESDILYHKGSAIWIRYRNQGIFSGLTRSMIKKMERRVLLHLDFRLECHTLDLILDLAQPPIYKMPLFIGMDTVNYPNPLQKMHHRQRTTLISDDHPLTKILPLAEPQGDIWNANLNRQFRSKHWCEILSRSSVYRDLVREFVGRMVPMTKEEEARTTKQQFVRETFEVFHFLCFHENKRCRLALAKLTDELISVANDIKRESVQNKKPRYETHLAEPGGKLKEVHTMGFTLAMPILIDISREKEREKEKEPKNSHKRKKTN